MPVTQEQQERIYTLADQGWSARKIAEEPDMPSHVTITNYLRRREEKVVEAQGLNTPTSKALNRASVNTEKEYHPFGVNRRPEESPVVKLSLHQTLVGMFLSPKELLDAKEAGALGPNAFLDAYGRVEIRKDRAEPSWPAYGQPTLGKTPGGTKFQKLHSEGSRPANRTNDRG